MQSRLSGMCNRLLALTTCNSMTVAQSPALRAPGELGNGRVHLDDLDGCDAPVLVVQEPGVSVLSKPPYALTQAA